MFLAFLLLTLASCQQPAGPGIGLAPGRVLKVDDLRPDADRRLASLLAGTDSDHRVFKRYNPNGPAQWSSAWTRRFDMTGIAWNRKRAGTAITPRHIVYAAHYQHKIGTKLVFHDRTGKPHTRKVVAGSGRLVLPSGWRTDIAVGLLDKPLPPSIKTYRLLPPRSDYDQILPGCPVLVTEQKRTLRIHQVRNLYNKNIAFLRNDRVSELHYKGLVVGDSGHPSFLIVGGEPVLLETHTGGGSGSGPFYSDPEVFKELRKAVAKLDSNYSVQTVPLDPAPIGTPAVVPKPRPNKRVGVIPPPSKKQDPSPPSPTVQPTKQKEADTTRRPRVRRVPTTD